MELRWVASMSASCWHATAAILAGRRLVDEILATALAEPVEALRRCALDQNLDLETVLVHLVPLSVGADNHRQLVSAALAKAVGPAHSREGVEALAARVVSLCAAFLRVYPQAAEELALRATPLREQWEARGPGLLHGIQRLTEKNLLVAQADVVLVHPVLGGGGVAHWPYNSVRFEAVLANPRGDLPEVARLAWLLAQLNLDLPAYRDHLTAKQLQRVGPLALLPPTLAAAEDVELARSDAKTWAAAVEFWGLDPVNLETLRAWWETYQSERPSWPLALAALDQMLETSAEY